MGIKMNFKIELTDKGLSINSTLLTFPISLKKLVEELKQSPNRINKPNFINRLFKGSSNTIYTWDDLGIYCYSKGKKRIEEVDILIRKDKSYEFDFMPKKVYQGILAIIGENIHERRLRLTEQTKTLQIYYTLNDDKNNIVELSISNCNTPLPPKDKYEIKPTNEDIIEFADINFKYAVINELMYNKEFLKPKFDLNEFVKLYENRLIDLEEEGYDLIPEVVEYFKKLPVPKRLAKEITEINQDGISGIYKNLILFIEGYEDYDNIESSMDAIHFPNLKKAFFSYADENVMQELRNMGIESDYWES